MPRQRTRKVHLRKHARRGSPLDYTACGLRIRNFATRVNPPRDLTTVPLCLRCLSRRYPGLRYPRIEGDQFKVRSWTGRDF